MKQDSAVKVGFLTIVAVLAAAFFVVWKEGTLTNLRNYKMYGTFVNVGGLLEGAEVRYRGFSVGKVSLIEPGPETAKVTLMLKHGTKVPVGAKLRIGFDGLIGQKFVEIILPDNVDRTKLLPPGSTMTGFASAGIVDFIDVGVSNLEELKQIISSLRELATDPQVKFAIKQSILNVELASTSLAQLFGQLNQALAGREKEIGDMVTSLSRISQVLDKSLGNLGQFFSDPTLAADLQNVRASVKNTAQNLSDITAKLDEMLSSPDNKGSIQSVAQAAQKTFNSVNAFLQKVNNFDFKAYSDLLYSPKDNNIFYKINADVQFSPEHYYHAAVGGGRGREGIEMMDLEFGKRFQNLDLKLGLYSRDLGGGVTFYPWVPGLAVSADAYNPNKLKIDLTGTYRIWNDFYLEAKVFNVNDNESRRIYGGMKINH